MGFWLQLRLLLWKNFTLRKRQPIRIVIEILWPLSLFLILVGVKLDNSDLQVWKHECHFDRKDMPSAGFLPFLQTLFCTMNNTCHQMPRPEEVEGSFFLFNSSIFSQLLHEFEARIEDLEDSSLIENLVEDVDIIKQLQELLMQCDFNIGSLIKDASNLQNLLSKHDVFLSQDLLNTLLESNVSGSELMSLISRRQFLTHLCQEDYLEGIIVSVSSEKKRLLKNELCKLTSVQLTSFLNDFFWSTDTTLVKNAIKNCALKKLGLLGSVKLLMQLNQISSDLNAAQEMWVKFNKTLSLASSLLLSSSWPYQQFQMNSSSWILHFASTVLCQSESFLNGSSQGDGDYFRQMLNNQKEEGEANFQNLSAADLNYDNSTTLFCNDVFYQIEQHENAGVRMLWRQVKPVIRGKIPYSPDTPVVRRIIKQANWTFEFMARIQKLAKVWLTNLPMIHQFITQSPAVNILQNLLIVSTREIDFNNTNPEIQEYLNISKWKDLLNKTEVVMTFISTYLECFQFDKFEPFNHESDLVKASLKFIEDELLWAGLVFNDNDQNPLSGDDMPNHISFKIRMDSDKVDSTQGFRVTDRYWSPGPRARPLPDMKYIVHGFAYLQDLVEHAIILELTGRDDVGISVQQFPYPCYIEDRFTRAISRSLPMLMTLAWIFSVALIVKDVVYEKERRLKEIMKVMGLGNGVHWLSWFITSFIMMSISVLLLVTVLKCGKVLEHSDGLVIFAFMVTFSIATIMQCFMFSTFFSRANLAAACAAIFYFKGYLPYALCIQWEEYMDEWQKILACLSSTVAFGFGCSYIARYEQQGVGMQWSSVRTSPIPEDTFNMFKCIVMMMVDSVIYFVITWYVEAVFPGQFGVPKPWYFCFTKSYWCSGKYLSDITLPVDVNIELQSNQEASGCFEAEPRHLKLGVAIKDLRKSYKNGQRLAVDNLSLTFYENQITSFLGHNGAGKTTTMSILTGLFPPTQGTAYIYGKDIRYEMDDIHKDMGICPQYNVLFGSLTVEEHLFFYGSLKGMRKPALNEEIKKMLADIGLPHKRHARVSSLSGGMKRKLSVAVAFTAGSRVVILDEPTAGVDPYARRSIWELLLKYKAGRTIILSTHFMDEADILGDRIAIISQGKLCCCGSSLFLKNLFGSGYHLTFTTASKRQTMEQTTRNGISYNSSYHDFPSTDVNSQTDDAESVSCGAKLANQTVEKKEINIENKEQQKVVKVVHSHIPQASLVENFESEFTFQLPDDNESVAKFDKLFMDIDKNAEKLGVTGYGISRTTLEEVFLRVAKLSGVDEENEETERQQVELLTDGGSFARPVTRFSFAQAKRRFFGMMLRKREGPSVPNGRMLDDEVAPLHAESLALLDNPIFAQDTLEDFVIGDAIIGTDDHLSADEPVQLLNQCNGAGTYRVSGTAPVLLHQFWAMFIKRFHYVRRSKKAFISQIVLPGIFICLAMIFAKINPPVPELPPMEIHPWLMTPNKLNDSHLYVFYSNNAEEKNWCQEMEDLLLSKPGLGTRCMDPDVHVIPDFPCAENAFAKQLRSSFASVYKNQTQGCSCDTGYQQCPADANEPEPSKYLLPTTDYLYNMTEWNISEWLIKTTHQYQLKRYGGLSFSEANSLVKVNKTRLGNLISRLLLTDFGLGNSSGLPSPSTIAAIIDDVNYIVPRLAVSKNAKVWFNNKGYASMVAYINVMNNLLLRANLEPRENLTKYGISITNHPMNRTKAQMAQYTIRASIVDALIAISVIFALSQIPASFVLFLIEERQSGSKHLQFVSGVNPAIYWTVSYVWDMCNYMVSATICIFLFLAFQQQEYVSAANAPCLIALLFLYGWAITPMMYPISYLFSVPSTAFVVMGCINIFIGILSTISTFILELFMEERLDRINNILRKVFLTLPHFCLGRGLIDMTRNQLIADVFAAFGEDLFKNPFSWDLVGRNLFCLFILGVVFFFLTLCIEYKFWIYKMPCFRTKLFGTRIPSAEEPLLEDFDVAAEQMRVQNGQTENDLLTVQGLTKAYRRPFEKNLHLAVNNITFGVKKGECFGLLGVNGAGKTTTFKMLTGDLAVTAGNAHLNGNSILTEMTSARKELGYCPQFDALISLLTATEHLELYARLRGVPEKDVAMVTKWAIQRFGLVMHQHKCAGDLSGGNKRKLSAAIAIVGNPSVVFLDEPTTGMDPKARRFLWNCINQIKRDGRSVILTSHSMEECEALCDRIAIMVNGSFKCLGSIQHLKNRFGDGYTVVIQISGEHSKLSPLKQFVAKTFPESQLKEQHHNTLHYHFTSKRIPLSYIFGMLESVRDLFSIEDYSVCQTTLDQVFINFAKFQSEVMNDEQNAVNHIIGTQLYSSSGL